MTYRSEMDLLEIPTEDHIIRRRALSYPGAREKFDEALENFSCVAHGISMSIGSVEALDQEYFRANREMMDQAGIKIFSEHLAYHRMDGKDISSFLGMPLCDESLEWLVHQYWHARELMGGPFALENVSLSYPVPEAQYSEPEFLTKFLSKTDGSLLLDVTNLYNNCTNFKTDPLEFLHALPGDRVSQIHLAGGHYDEDGFLIDSHSFAVMDEVWDIFRAAIHHTNANIVIVERDYKCFPFREVMADVRKAREIFYEIRPNKLPEVSVEADPEVGKRPIPDAEDSQFADLRNFQRATIRSITDDDYRGMASSTPEKVSQEFPMAQEWIDRFAKCDKLDSMAHSWKETDRYNREDAERFRQWEWNQWAMQSRAMQSK